MTTPLTDSFTLVRRLNRLAVYQNDRTGRFHLVRIGEHCGIAQVYSVVPGDLPADGGVWVANHRDAGIAYVSHGYSRSYVNRVVRSLTEWD